LEEFIFFLEHGGALFTSEELCQFDGGQQAANARLVVT
jgi:hypothetical protein